MMPFFGNGILARPADFLQYHFARVLLPGLPLGLVQGIQGTLTPSALQ